MLLRVVRCGLRALKKRLHPLKKRVEHESQSHITSEKLYPISEDILELFKNAKRLTLSEIVELTNANRNTVKVRLRELVASGHISQHGKARATNYKLTAFGRGN